MNFSDKLKLTVCSAVAVAVTIASVFCAYLLYEVPYQDAVRAASAAASMASMTGASDSIARSSLAYSHFVRSVVWTFVILLPYPATMYAICEPARKIFDHWRNER